jgi:hypothetical protein
MALASVTREQFEIRSEVELVHTPTGLIFGRILTSTLANLDNARESAFAG